MLKPTITKPRPEPTTWRVDFTREQLAEALEAYCEVQGVRVPRGRMQAFVRDDRRGCPCTLIVDFDESD